MLSILFRIAWINLAFLIFNMLPIYPLDGGQILRSLLWFPLGEIRSLQVASGLGFRERRGGALALYAESFWIGILAFFLISRAIAGWRHAQRSAARRANRAACPRIGERPPLL